jgi:cytochrome b6-f complex iron-sulfur subunit
LSECTRRALLGGAMACIVGCGGQKADTSDLPPAGSEGWWFVAFADYPELADVGGSAQVDVFEALLHVVIVRTGRREAAAVWAICSHGACVVAFEGADDELVCPCHGSRFGLDGEVHDGPAPAPLDVFPTALADDGIWVWRPSQT